MRVAYLSYDGALDPLGANQVVPYLEGLSLRGVEFDLITFEKRARLDDTGRVASMSARLSKAGIQWHPLRYHRSPRVPATLFDVGAGALRLRQLSARTRFDLFHCRGEITPLMVRFSRLKGPMLLDMRGFFSDERVDAGSWPAGGVVDRATRAIEKRNLLRAARLVVLTERGREVLQGRGVGLPIDVIPTCVDCEVFTPPSPKKDAAFDFVYFGSLGGWYMTEEMLRFVATLQDLGDSVRVLFLTNSQNEAALPRLRAMGVTVESAAPEAVPGWLSQCKATFFFIRATHSKIASCPTKLAEGLAMGLPVLTGPGVGDVDSILREESVGVVLDDFSKESFLRGWKAMKVLLADPHTAQRCRAVARNRLSLESAVERYYNAYGQMFLRPPEAQ